MQVSRIPLKSLKASGQPRPLVTEAVDRLAASIGEVGLIQPITVRSITIMNAGLAEDGFQVVAGHHRVAACRALGWTEIEALVIGASDHLSAELIEIDENLCRSELTASQRAQAIKRRKAIWEALHPGETGGKSFSTCLSDGRAAGPQHEHGFAASTAAAAGMTKQAINQHLARAEALGDDLPRVAGTSLDKGVELDALKAMTPEQRAPIIERAQAGEKVSARDTSKPASPILTPSMRLQMALMHGIGRALESAGVKTAEELVAQIMALPVRERDFLANQLDVFEYVGCLGSNRGGA